MNKIKVCYECGAIEQYKFKDVIRRYKGEGYDFEIIVRVPFCEKCRTPIYVEDVEKEIALRVNAKIMEQKNIITQEEMLGILEKYSISQKFLSKLLGWGEITLTRYIRGKYTPNTVNSNRLRELKNPYVFQALLKDYQGKNMEISEEKAFKKVEEKVYFELKQIEKSQGRLFSVINWFLAQSSEEEPITHMAMQNILYFVQGWSMVLLDEEMFVDESQAWENGVVYPKVYNMFNWFKHNLLPKVETETQFTDNELIILSAVKNFYFDVYSANSLGYICRKEKPYVKARTRLLRSECLDNVIKRDDVLSYYGDIVKKFDIKIGDLSNIKKYLYCIRS